MTLMGEEVLPSRRTCCVRLERNECTQLSACGEMLYSCIISVVLFVHSNIYCITIQSVVSYVRQFDLVCERAYLSYLATTIYFLGVMLGGLTFGPLAEKYGRRPVLLVSLVASVVFSISLTLVNSYVAFVLIRLVNGFFLQVG